jgi:hypothetical protein
MQSLIGICFWGGVPEGVVEEIGEGRKGVAYWGDKRSAEPWKDFPKDDPRYFDPREIMKTAEAYWTEAVEKVQVYRGKNYVPRDRLRIVIRSTWKKFNAKQLADYWFEHALRNVTGDYKLQNVRKTIESMKKANKPLTVTIRGARPRRSDPARK